MYSTGTRGYASSAGASGRSFTTRNTSRRRISAIQRSHSARAISNCFVGSATPSPTPGTCQPIGRNFTAKDHADLIDAAKEAVTAAGTALTKAGAAETAAEKAETDAAAAQSSAQAAQTAASTAEAQATAANTAAQDASTAAEAAQTVAQSAAGAASSAQTAAEAAQSSAQTAQNAATAAKESADEAVEKVEAIQEAKGAAGGFASLQADGTVTRAQRAITDDTDQGTKFLLGVEAGKLYIMEAD